MSRCLTRPSRLTFGQSPTCSLALNPIHEPRRAHPIHHVSSFEIRERCHIHVRRNLLASLVSGILAVLAGVGGLFAGTEPPVQQAAQPQQDEQKLWLDLFLMMGFTLFAAISKASRASARVIHFITISATTIVFSLPASGIFALALRTSATILAALIMDCRITSRRSTDISQLNMW